jgi:XTP/dITP diphosphohydrolase
MKIILSTRNKEKAKQIGAVFADSDIAIVSLDEAGIQGKVIEDGNSLEDNARKKALFAYEESTTDDVWFMADDTGIFIDALGGEPGKDAAIWGGEGLSTKERMRFCLEKLRGKIDRSATFKTCVCLVSPQGDCRFFYGKAPGEILKEPRCEPQDGMPYSAIFKPNASDKVWAEMSTEEENAISHRGKAFQQVLEFFSSVSSK